MTALAVIGWAFIAGLAVVAFAIPIFIAEVIYKRAAPPTAPDGKGDAG